MSSSATSPAPVRVGILGAGSWAAAAHLPSLASRGSEVELVGICRTGRRELDRLAREWGASVASEDYRDLLAAGLDACIVASPGGLHGEHVRAALESGAHVLCEKPFTFESSEAWELVEAAAARSLALTISYGFNYLPMTRAAKQLMASPGIGTIESLSLTMASTARELLSGGSSTYPGSHQDFPPLGETWHDPALAGGGYGQGQLTHALGAALWLTELRAAEVFAFEAPAGGPLELHNALSVRFTNGAVGAVHGGASHLGIAEDRDQIAIVAIGSEGMLRVDYGRDEVVLFRAAGGEHRIELPPGAGDYRCDGPAQALVDLAQGREGDCAPGELGARVVELLAAAYRSQRQGGPVATAALGPEDGEWA